MQKKGHIIIDTNFRYERNEIDIISLEKDILVFTEIKTRTHFNFGYPEEAVTLKKQDLIKKTAEFFLQENEEYQKVRFDIISILIRNGQVLEIKHFIDAFY